MDFFILNDIVDSWNNASTRHAMLVHMPIALAMLGVPLVVAAWIGGERTWPRVLAVLGYLLLFGASWIAYESGLDAEAGAGASITVEGNMTLETHKELANIVRWLAAGVVLVLLVAFVRARRVRHGSMALALLGALTVAGWVTVVSHHGGTLVYVHGLGVTSRMPGGPSGIVVEEDAQAGDATEDVVGSVDPRVVYFRQTVRPILESRCWGCHNPVRAADNGELDLTSMNAIMRANRALGDDDELIVWPGRPAQSLLNIAVSYEDPFMQMPPSDHGQLPTSEIEALSRWVQEGAVWGVRPHEQVERAWRAALDAAEQSAKSDENNAAHDGGSW